MVDVEKEIADLLQLPKKVPATLNPAWDDSGLANIDKVGELMGQGLRDIFMEAAKRARATGEKAMKEASEYNDKMVKLAQDCEQLAEASAKDVEDRAALARQLSEGATKLTQIIANGGQLVKS